MELHQLRYLVSVAEEGSFTAAAGRELVSQSGVSAQVAKLERELGQPLLERGNRRVTLTPAGEAVLPLAKAALAAVDGIRAAADEVSNLVRGRTRMGMIVGCSVPPFLDALADFHRRYPGVEVSLSEDDSAVMQRQVLAGVLDLALIGFAEEVEAGLDVDVLVDEPLVAAVAPSHRLARRRVRLADLDGETVLCLPAGTGIRQAYERSCRRLGRSARVDLEASSPDTVLGLARRGVGAAVVSASMVGDGLLARPLVDADVHAKLGLVTRAGTQSSATGALLAALTPVSGSW